MLENTKVFTVMGINIMHNSDVILNTVILC